MSSSDYTSIRKIRQMYSHQNDNCRSNDYGKRFEEFLRRMDDYAKGCHNDQMTPLGYNRQNGIGYYVPPNQVDNDNSPPGMRSKISQLTVTNRYHTKTIKSYLITPIRDGAITFTVDIHLHNFAQNQSVSIYSDSNPNNFFEGIINRYDPATGEITINMIESINGNFNSSAIYNVCLLTLNPDLIQLKNRMNELYQFLFQVNLEEYPNYNPVVEQMIIFSQQINNLYYYFFTIDLTLDSNYQINDDNFLNEKLNNLYKYFFNLDVTINADFNPNGGQIKLFSIKNRINQLYLYLFNINLNEGTDFDPNNL
jgi:hypothetical protein